MPSPAASDELKLVAGSINQSQADGSAQQLKACLACQKRKSKCTGETPCSFCVRTHRSCVYTARPVRTPLTRKNLDTSEQRCVKLMALLKSLNPDVDIENLLENGLPSDRQPVTKQSPRSPQQIDEASPGSSHDYEWHEAPLSNDEAVHSLQDGMALLSTEPSGSGYLGSSAGSSMLQTICSLLSLKGPLDEPSKNEISKLIATGQRQRSDSGVLLLEGQLASSAITDGLIDAYFLLYNTSYPVLHSQIFRDNYANRSEIPNTSTWQLVFYTVLAIGHWVLSSGEDHADSPYYLAARSRMSAGMLESGTLTGVQAFLLMGNYLQKRDRPNTGYNMIGIAFRMALGLGLHREISAGEQNTLSKEIRRRVWWILYMVDSGFSITMGRPTTASDAFIDVQIPENIEDSYFTSDELTVMLPPPVDYPTTYSAMIAQARLCIIANKIYNEFLAAHIINATISEELAYKFEEELRDWRTSLPKYFIDMDTPTWFHGPRAVIFWKEQNLRMMLWRGGQKSNRVRARSELATQNYIQVALESVRAICSFCTANDRLHQGLSWYATYFLFQAVLVLDFSLLQSPEDEQASVLRNSIDDSRHCFSKLGVTNPAALRCISVLDRIHSHHQNLASNSHQLSEGLEENSISQFSDVQNSIVLDGQGDFLAEHQIYSADPALQLFLDGPPMNNLFDGVYGFPSTQEQEHFDYVPGDYYNMDDFDMNFNWTNSQT